MGKDRSDELHKTIKLDPPEGGARGFGARKAFLTVIRGGKRDLGKHVVVDQPVTVGRAPECDLPLQDMVVSWRHARVYSLAQEAFILEDMGSTNGTRLNGGLCQGPQPLRDGEKIFVGETVIRFSLADEMDLGFHDLFTQLVNTDPLTGLHSKRKFDDALDFAFMTASRDSRALSILMMDMDGVKQINDKHGHLFGAHVIGETGRLIDKVLGDRGKACRFGGDEFTAFLPDLDKDQAGAVAEEIRKAVDTAGFTKEDILLHPTLSIGVAAFPQDGSRVLDLIEAADQALYRAKGSGKNRVSF